LAELGAALEASRITEEVWGDRYTTDIDIQKNQAEIIVPNKARFEAAMRRADAEMPEHTAVVEGVLPKPV
jgi:hypothetical protein